MTATTLVGKMFHNATRGLDKYLGAWQSRAVKKLIKGICQNKTTVLQKLRDQDMGITANKFRESLSYHLGNIDLSDLLHEMTKKLVKKTQGYNGYTILSGDASDIFKPHAKVMEGISCVRDGSTGLIGNGYVMYGININGITHQIDLLDQSIEYIGAEKREEMLTRSGLLVNPQKTIGIFDRGHDDIGFIDILQELGYHYVVRGRKNRIVTLVNSGKQIKVGELGVGKREVLLESGTKSYAYVVQGTGKVPVILYSDVDFATGSECLEIYLKRRQIELDYSKMKSFGLEHVRVMSFKKIQSVIHIIQFIIMFGQDCYNEIQAGIKVIPYKLLILYKQYCQKTKKTGNPNSFLSFVSIYISGFIIYNTNQIPALTLFGNRRRMKKVGLI